MTIPEINIEPLINGTDSDKVAWEINMACRKSGFFYISDHGVDPKLQAELDQLSRKFFSLPEPVKLEISMDRGGKAWRGYFPLKAELTSGKPDLKEGLYFGEELSEDHPKVASGVPLHGPNLFPEIEGFSAIVPEYMGRLKRLGLALMRGIALSLKLPAQYFEQHYMNDPLVLFRIFHYPAVAEKHVAGPGWGVGEHTDYGVLTILKQDDIGGLQVYSRNKWVSAPYIENTFICNIGDMLDLMTGGYYRSTPHRVRNTAGKDRLSYPFFLDLDFDCFPKPLDLSHLGHTKKHKFERWDSADLQGYTGSYGSYILNKISRVFPQLGDNVL